LWIVDINQFSVTWIGLGVKRSRLRRPTPLPGITPQRSGIRYAIPPSVPRDPSCPHGRSIWAGHRFRTRWHGFERDG